MLPIAELIQGIINESLILASKKHGADMPVTFDINEYEYHSDDSKKNAN